MSVDGAASPREVLTTCPYCGVGCGVRVIEGVQVGGGAFQIDVGDGPGVSVGSGVQVGVPVILIFDKVEACVAWKEVARG